MNFYGQNRFGLVFILLLPLTLFSCVRENESDVDEREGAMTLNISCSDMTRATDPGSDDFKENLLLTLDIFYYRTATDADCFEHDRVIETYNGSATYTKDLEILTKEKFFGTGETGSCYVYVIANGPQTKIDSLLNRDIASVANLKQIVLASPDLGNSEVDPDMGSKLVRQNYFVMDGGATMTYSNGSASVNVKLARSLSKIQLYVHFPDSVIVNGKTYKPSIISVNGIESDEIKAWGKAVFNNGLMRGYVNDSISRHYSPSDKDYYPASGLSYDAKARYIRKDTLSISHKKDSVTYTYYTHSPFYTYPMTWETFRSNLSTRPTTLMLVVDWYSHESTGMTSKTTFYTIDVNSSQASGEVYKFKRNTFYKLYVDVNTIGSDTSTEPIEITGECEILDWNHVNQETSVENLRYLTVEQNSYEMDNEMTLYIPYSTSHKCKISMVRVWKNNLRNELVTIDSLVNTTYSLSSGGTAPSGYSQFGEYVVDTMLTGGTDRPYSFKLTDNRIIFQHMLDNRTDADDDNFDYVPFEVDFRIEHEDNSSFFEIVHITQHPEISVVPQINTDYTEESPNITDNTVNNHSGYAYVNGFNVFAGEGATDDSQLLSYVELSGSYYLSQGYINSFKSQCSSLVYYNNNNVYSWYLLFSDYYDTDRQRILASVTGLEQGTEESINTNPNRYVVRTAVASGESSYIIGNPISSTIDTLPVTYQSNKYGWSKKSPSLDGTFRKLKYYYPTREDSQSKYMLAPIFMVASSYGATSALTRENAKRRCASYQEEGYPAGRWRIPTNAEVRFCTQLTQNRMIPILFGGKTYNAWYWTSTGTVYLPAGATSVTEYDGEYTSYAWVRCVYDIWYWGKEMPVSKTEFQGASGTVNAYRFTWGDKSK